MTKKKEKAVNPTRIDWSKDHENWVFPSNLNWQPYFDWANKEYRGEYGVTVVVLHSPNYYDFWVNKERLNERQGKVLELMRPLENLLDDTPFPTGGRARFDFDAVPISRTLWEMMGPLQRKWVTAECYVNVGFEPIDIVHDTPTKRMIASTLTVYDYLCERHSCLCHEEHEPIEARRDIVRQLSLEMGLVVQNDMLYLPKRLREYRNKIAVMARACLMGQDPISAYHRFLGTSSTNFLMIEEKELFHVRDSWITPPRHFPTGPKIGDEEPEE